MKIRNNSPEFGDPGPFEVDAATFEEACEKLADEMMPDFHIWASEKYESEYYALRKACRSTVHLTKQIRAEFIAGLEVCKE